VSRTESKTNRTSSHHSSGRYRVDYNIHGVLGVRLVNAAEEDAAAVARQLGPFEGQLSGPPDVTVEFVDRIVFRELSYIEHQKTGVGDGEFCILGNGQGARAIISFDQIGRRSTMVSLTGIKEVPFLLPVLHLEALKHDLVAVNASAFIYEDVGVLATGWPKGGKIEALLAFGLRGAKYVGDQWTILSGDGKRMFGLPENAGLWEWGLERVKPGRAIQSGTSRFQPLTGPTKVFLLISGDQSAIRVEPSEPREIADRLISVLEWEHLPMLQSYLAFKFAFPERRSELIEHVREVQGDILSRALADKEAYTVWHSYPVALPELYDAMSRFIER